MGNDKDQKKGVSRRDLLTFWRRPLAEALKPAPAPAPFESPATFPLVHHLTPGVPPLRPPGTMNELLLVEYCVRCGKCAEACPAQAIFPLDAA